MKHCCTPIAPGFAFGPEGLACAGVPLTVLANTLDTPLFVYSEAAIVANYQQIAAALAALQPRIAYAAKANGNLALLRRLHRLGACIDIVSAGELHRALLAGFAPSQIVYSGVGKRRDELTLALDNGIRSIHVESAAELWQLESLAQERGHVAAVTLRVNPDVDPHTHPYIATGMQEAKFGLDIPTARALLPRLLQSPHLRLEGIACHIGSQLGQAAPLQQAVATISSFACDCCEAGAPITLLDVGGGWPVHYGDNAAALPSYADFGAAVQAGLQAGNRLQQDFEIWTEPGRALIGNAGVLLSRVLYRKENTSKRFVIVDAAMTELLRPALYQAYHAITPVCHPERSTRERVDVVGPVCESGDFLAKDRDLPALDTGELIAIWTAGAYAAAMTSDYNARRRPAEVLIGADGQCSLIRARQPYASLWDHECEQAIVLCLDE